MSHHPRPLRHLLAPAVAGVLIVGVAASALSATGAGASRWGGGLRSGNAATSSLGVASSSLASATLSRPRVGRFLGIVPVRGSGASSAPTSGALTPKCASGCNPPLIYHGGPVQHSPVVYSIFWIPSSYYLPTGYRGEVNQFFTDVASSQFSKSNVFGAATQYYDGSGSSKHFVTNDVTFGGSFIDRRSLPASGCPNYFISSSMSTHCLTDSQVVSEINSDVTSKGLPTGTNVEYLIFTPPLLGGCFLSNGVTCYAKSGGYCAYHSSYGPHNTTYANMPYGDVVGCQSGEYPNEDPADPMVSTLSHEENETMTDPLGNAWWDASQFENGDECAYIYGTPLGGTGIGTLDLFNQMINRDAYYLQGEYSNRVGNCVWSNTFPSPTASFTSSSDPTVNVAVKFTGKASETGTTSFTFRWSFGDGKTATGRTPSHTFTKAGKFQVKMVAFDSHGDSGRSTRTITIASS